LRRGDRGRIMGAAVDMGAAVLIGTALYDGTAEPFPLYMGNADPAGK
jgi:hypothetical protein